jgi:poly-gamma-glutamate synthesis protein (capsule biosynthesis protein)
MVSLFLSGDVMTGRGVDQVLPHPSNPRIYERYAKSAVDYVQLAERKNGPIAKPVGHSYVWGDALDELERRSPDVRIINLETSITKHDKPAPKGINYRMSPENAHCIPAAAIDCCVLANNHVLDWESAGCIETLETLHGMKVKTAGAGRDLAEAAAPGVLQTPWSTRILVFGLGSVTSGIPTSWAATATRPGVNLLSDLSSESADRFARQVRAVRRSTDIVVASIHWGSNWGYRIPNKHRAFAHRLIDEAEVDIVHGHSSHHPRGVELYQGKPILYGCGDLINDYEGIGGYESYRGELSLMYFVTMDPETRKLARLEMSAFEIKRFRLNHASRKDAQWLCDTLAREGRKLGTTVTLMKDNTLRVLPDGG